MSFREIVRRKGLSRNTIRKHLRSHADELHYSKWVSPYKLDPFALTLGGWTAEG